MLGFAENETREDSIGKVDRSAITGFFRPEFFNRLDQVAYFDPLNKEAIEEITRKEIEEVSRRAGLPEKGIDVDQKLIRDLAAKGFDPVYGARPLQRTIEENLILPLARWLSGELIPDKARIAVKPDSDDVSFKAIRT